MNYAQVQSHLRYAAKKTGMIYHAQDKTVCPIRKRKVDTYSYNYTGIPNALVDAKEHNFIKYDKKEPTIIVDTDTFKVTRCSLCPQSSMSLQRSNSLNSIEALNKDVYETIVACLGIALGQEKYDSADWTFTNDGNLVVKE